VRRSKNKTKILRRQQMRQNHELSDSQQLETQKSPNFYTTVPDVTEKIA